MGIAERVEGVTDWGELLGAARHLAAISDPAASARYATEFGLDLLNLCYQAGLDAHEQETLVTHAEFWLARPRWAPQEVRELLSRQLAAYARFRALDPFTREAFRQLSGHLANAA